MYKDLFVLPGTLETPEEINAAVAELTGDPEPWADPDDEREEWRAWIEYRDGNTIVLCEEA